MVFIEGDKGDTLLGKCIDFSNGGFCVIRKPF